MTSDASLSRRRLRAWIRLLRLTRQSEKHLRGFLRDNYNTTLPRFDVMAALHRAGQPVKMSDLSRALLVSNGNATNVVDRLEKDGLAERRSVRNDRRVAEVRLTDAGRQEFETLAAAHEAEVNKLFAGLGANELDVIRALLKRAEGDVNDQDI